MGTSRNSITHSCKNASKTVRVPYSKNDLIILDGGRTMMLASGAANQGYGSDYVESPADIARNVVYMITQQYLSGRSKNKPTVIVIFDGYMRASIKKRGDYSNLYHRAQLQAQDILLRIQKKNPGRLGFIIIRSVAEADFDVLKLEQDFAKIKPITRDATQVFVEPAPAHTSAATIEGEDREHIEEEVMRIARAIDEARDALNLVGVGAEDDLDTDEAIDQSREVHKKGQPQDGGEEVVLPEYINDHSDSPADQGAADFIRCRVVSNDGDLFMHSDATTLIAEGRQCAGNIFKVNTADFLAKVKDEIVKRNLDGKHASLIAFMTFAFLGDYRMINYKGMGEVAFFNIIANALEAAQDVQEGDAAEESAGGIHARRFFASIARQFAKARTEKKIGSLSKEELISLHTDDLREINEQVVRHVNDAIKSVAFACAPLGVCDSLLKCMPKIIRVYLKERTGIDISVASSNPSAGVYLSTSPHIVLLRQLLMIKSGHSHLINNQQISIPEAMSSWIAELGVTGVPGYGTRLEEHPFEPLRKSKVPQVEHDKFLELMEGIKPIPQSLLPVDMARRRTDSDASMTELMGSDDEDLPVGDQPSSRAAHDRTARPKLFLDPSEAGDSAHTAAELQDPIFKAISVIASNYRQREEDRRAAWIRVDAERRSQAAALFSRVLKKKLFQDVDCSGADAADRLIRFHQTEYLPPYRLDALTEAVNRLEMSLTAFDQPVIDLLGSSDILMMLLEGHNRPHKDATRVVFRILYEIVPKHRKDERCQAAQHLAKRLWSSQAARQYCLRLSNTARVLGMAHVVGIDGNFADGLTDPLILHTGDVGGATLPWTWLERFCHHLASTHIPYEDIQYLDARGATDKIYIDLGYSLEDALDGRLASRASIIKAVLGPALAMSKPTGLQRSDVIEARHKAAQNYLDTLKPASNNQEAAQTTVAPHASTVALVKHIKDWHVMPSGLNAPEILELFDRPLFRDNREAQVFFLGRPLQQYNSQELLWLSRMGLRSETMVYIFRKAVKDVAAMHERTVLCYGDLSHAIDRMPASTKGGRTALDRYLAKQKIAVAIIAAMLKMLEQPADACDLEYCDYLHYRNDIPASNETTRNWQRVPVKLPTSLRQQAEADYPGVKANIRRSPAQIQLKVGHDAAAIPMA